MGRISKLAFFAVLALPLTASADPAEDYAHQAAAAQVQAGIYAERANYFEKLPAADAAKLFARSGENPEVARAELVKKFRADAASLTKQGAAAGGRTDVLRSIAIVHRSAGARMTLAELQQTTSLDTLEQQGLSSNIAYFNAVALLTDLKANRPNDAELAAALEKAGVRPYDLPLGAGNNLSERLESGLTAEVANQQARIAALVTGTAAYAKARDARNNGPQLRVPGPPAGAPGYLSGYQAVAHANIIPAAGLNGKIAKYGGGPVIFEALAIVQTGFNAGAYVVDPTLEAQNIELGKRRLAYQEEMRKWENGGRQTYEAAERESRRYEDKIADQERRVVSLLSLPLFGGPLDEAGFNGDRPSVTNSFLPPLPPDPRYGTVHTGGAGVRR